MKKWSVILCAGALAFSLAACGNAAGDKDGATASQETTQEAAPEKPEAKPTEEPAGGDAGAEVSGGETGSDAVGAVSLQDIKSAIVEELGDDYWPNMEMSGEMLEGNFGVTSDMYDDFLAESPMIGTNVDTLVLLHAKEGQAGALYDALTAYRENLVNDTMQYPMNLGKIQASRVDQFGDYVCFIQLGAEAVELEDEAAVIAKCQEVNETVAGIIREKVGE